MAWPTACSSRAHTTPPRCLHAGLAQAPCSLAVLLGCGHPINCLPAVVFCGCGASMIDVGMLSLPCRYRRAWGHPSVRACLQGVSNLMVGGLPDLPRLTASGIEGSEDGDPTRGAWLCPVWPVCPVCVWYWRQYAPLFLFFGKQSALTRICAPPVCVCACACVCVRRCGGTLCCQIA